MNKLIINVDEMTDFGNKCLKLGSEMGWDQSKTIITLSLLSEFLCEEHGLEMESVTPGKLDS